MQLNLITPVQYIMNEHNDVVLVNMFVHSSAEYIWQVQTFHH